MNEVDKITDEIMKANGAKKAFKINDGNFFLDLIGHGNNILRNFFIFLIIISLLFVGSVHLFRYAYEYAFYKPDIIVNKEGAIITKTSLSQKEEQVLFLLNPSILWANTGIHVAKGDEISLSASGGFHSDIKELIDYAKENMHPKHKWMGIQGDTNTFKKDTVRPYIISNAPFGSLLIQICADALPPRPIPLESDNVAHFYSIYQYQTKSKLQEQLCSIMKVSPKRPIKSEVDGTIYFAVNDIFLTDALIESYLQKKDLKPQVDKTHNDISIQYYQKHRDLWFQDNIGNILVVLNIKRN